MHTSSTFKVLSGCLLMMQIGHLFAQDVDRCPSGWEEVVRAHLVAKLDRNFEAAASHLVKAEQQAWLEWQLWKEEKLMRTLGGMAPELQQRHAEDVQQERDRLDLSHCTCEPRAGEGEGNFRVRVDPDGRSFKVINMVHSLETGWRVQTRHVMLDGEQARMATAFMRAVEERNWELAKVWVVESALPRFEGYTLEVETFLKGSEFLRESRAEQAAARDAEWPDVMLWAERQMDGVMVVHAEFQNLPGLSCEMVLVDGGWRILMR
jgi:hypothetical protein